MTEAFRFTCPSCKTGLIKIDENKLRCPADGGLYIREQGIWRFLAPQQRLEYHRFIQEYSSIRSAEGRGSSDPEYYRSLPFRDLTGRYTADWKIRASSFRALLTSVIVPFEKRMQRPLNILDIGAGNGWLSYRMAQRGHHAAAIDLQTNIVDGLGAASHYDLSFLKLQADFQHLPLENAQADLAIFNASFHYSTSYLANLCETLRVLRTEGRIVILDTPIYHDAHSGQEMVAEREEHFRKEYGFASNALPSENYLTYHRLEELSRQTDLRWSFVNAFYGLRWSLRPIKARFSGRREPAQFRIVIGSRLDPGQ